ncbi:MAG: hypothetical protein IT322_07170 [Anaerolineae bacterium]|nr:hypothetical protein [Anaerolineae bacterium]
MRDIRSGQEHSCSFEANQLSDGSIFLLCVEPETRFRNHSRSEFQGVTDDGAQVSSNVLDRPHRQSNGDQGTRFEFLLHQLDVRFSTESPAQFARFGIANFEFLGTEPNPQKLVLPLTLKAPDRLHKVIVEPIEDYEGIIERIKTLPRGVDVTCEAVVTDIGNAGDDGFNHLDETISDLCIILSMARGTRVNWTYRSLFDASGTLQSRVHHSHITRSFQVMPAIEPMFRDDTRVFIEAAYRKYADNLKKQTWYRRIINAYLDARSDGRFIEARAASLALVLEVIREAAPTLLDLKGDGQIMDRPLFQKLKSAIGELIKETVSDEEKAKQIKEKLGELNRPSFRFLIEQICSQIGLQLNGTDVALFVTSRNALVHTGQFCCETPTEKEQKRFSSPVEEYFFLVHFLDRILLKLFEYSGSYVDWRLPGSPQTRSI